MAALSDFNARYRAVTSPIFEALGMDQANIESVKILGQSEEHVVIEWVHVKDPPTGDPQRGIRQRRMVTKLTFETAAEGEVW